MPVTLDPISSGPADGYYVKRDKVIRTAGQDNFDLGFNLDNTATTADEDIAQAIFDQADRFVDQRAFLAGITVDSGATSPHYLATTNVIFDSIGDWASRWARAEGYLLRGVSGNEDSAKAEGQMTNMKDEAKAAIDELFLGFAQQQAGGGEGGFQNVSRLEPTCASDENSGCCW